MASDALQKGASDIAEPLNALHQTLMRTSICGLGQVALLPIVDALKTFPNEPSLQALQKESP
jgi:hypothetical protein